MRSNCLPRRAGSWSNRPRRSPSDVIRNKSKAQGDVRDQLVGPKGKVIAEVTSLPEIHSILLGREP